MASFGLCGLHPFANDAGITLTVTLDHYTEMLFNFLASELWDSSSHYMKLDECNVLGWGSSFSWFVQLCLLPMGIPQE